MGFGTPQIISQETVEDTNPDLYARRAENELSQRRIGSAINEIDRAIKYSGRNVHYIYEKVKSIVNSYFNGIGSFSFFSLWS